MAFLRQRGFEKITLIGGSMGGEAVLLFVSDYPPSCVDQVIVLAPYGGTAIRSGQIDKLFVVAAGDRLGLRDHVRDLYQRSADPGQIKIYQGPGHAQHLFNGLFGSGLLHLVVSLIGAEAELARFCKDPFI